MKTLGTFLLCFALTLALLLSIMNLGAVGGMFPRLDHSSAVAAEPTRPRSTAAAPNPTPIVVVPAPNGGTRIEGYTTANGYVEVQARGAEFGARGQVCVTNGGDQPTTGLQVVDQIQSRASGDFADVDGASITLLPQRQLNPGESDCYPYEISLTPVAGASYRNAARVTITNYTGWTAASANCPGPGPCAFGPLLVAGFALPPPATATPPPTVIVLPPYVPTATPQPRPPPRPAACATVPLLRSPVYGSTVRYARVLLDWSSVACAARYELVLRGGYSGSILAQPSNLYQSAYWTVPLSRGRYYWQVRACSAGGCSRWSTVSYFYVSY